VLVKANIERVLSYRGKAMAIGGGMQIALRGTQHKAVSQPGANSKFCF